MQIVSSLILRLENVIKKLKSMSKKRRIYLAINSIFKVFNSTLDDLHELEELVRSYGKEDPKQDFYFIPKTKIIREFKEHVSKSLYISKSEVEVLFQKNWQIVTHALSWNIFSEFHSLCSQYPGLNFRFSLLGDGMFAFQMPEFKVFLDHLDKKLKEVEKAIAKDKDVDFINDVNRIVNEIAELNRDIEYYIRKFSEFCYMLESSCAKICKNAAEMLEKQLKQENLP